MTLRSCFGSRLSCATAWHGWMRLWQPVEEEGTPCWLPLTSR